VTFSDGLPCPEQHRTGMPGDQPEADELSMRRDKARDKEMIDIENLRDVEWGGAEKAG